MDFHNETWYLLHFWVRCSGQDFGLRNGGRQPEQGNAKIFCFGWSRLLSAVPVEHCNWLQLYSGKCCGKQLREVPLKKIKRHLFIFLSGAFISEPHSILWEETGVEEQRCKTLCKRLDACFLLLLTLRVNINSQSPVNIHKTAFAWWWPVTASRWEV